MCVVKKDGKTGSKGGKKHKNGEKCQKMVENVWLVKKKVIILQRQDKQNNLLL